jgi:pimeloyl-ACP methyl ester carboxylesterase
MTVVGADAEQLRTTAKQLNQAADRLQSSVRSLTTLVSNASMWRGPDSDQFRSEWKGQSAHAINAAVDKLRAGAEALRRNADQQEAASRGETGAISGPGGVSTRSSLGDAPTGLHGMWDEIHKIPNGPDSTGYRVVTVDDGHGNKRYIVYIVGTGGSSTQTVFSNGDAAIGQLDEDQVKGLENLIPKDAEVMLVGYSQGGMDAQNIAASHRLNVQQVVTFGSPVRGNLDVPAIHLQANGDGVPGSAAGVPGPYFWSAMASDNDPEVFRGTAQNYGPSNHLPLDIHSGAYGDLSTEFDKEAHANGAGGGRAASAASGLNRFQGTVVDQVDIAKSGSGGGGW